MGGEGGDMECEGGDMGWGVDVMLYQRYLIQGQECAKECNLVKIQKIPSRFR